MEGAQTVKTAPIAGQATGTSGLRKKVTVFQEPNYLSNWIQSLFNTMQDMGCLKGATLVLGGDGRYWNKEALQIIIKMAAANEVSKVFVGKDGIISTPAVSAIIRHRKTTGGIILTASHNPGGPKADFGIKYNIENGGPAPEKVTNGIYAHTQRITEYKIASFPDVDLGDVGKVHTIGSFSVEIIDPVDEYLELLQHIFDFDALKKLAHRNFKLKIDAMHGVTGGYVTKIFGEVLGFPQEALLHAVPKEDFDGGHPDPNLTYAEKLVKEMYSGEYDFGAAFDGDGDRNMILGKKFFVTPSDSVAIIADHAHVIPYFSKGLNAAARSMPTGAALDRVAQAKNIKFYEVPTGWKFFGNIMDHYGSAVVCGEESFGTGADHIREKDGIWAVLAWLSILAHHNSTVPEGEPLVSVEEVVKKHWRTYGRNFFARYDYEEVSSESAKEMMTHVANLMNDYQSVETRKRLETDEYKLESCDDFEYRDPFDGSVSSHQGYRFVYNGGSRIIFRLSGTGSSGATIRLYVERYESDQEKLYEDTLVGLKGLIDLALSFSELQRYTGRDKPTVIT